MTIDEKAQEYFDKNFTYNQVYKQGIIDGHNKAIDDFVESCDNQFIAMYGQRYIDMRNIKEIAEQLKAGGENEN